MPMTMHQRKSSQPEDGASSPVPEDSMYRMLVESMNEGAAILASDGIILFCNPSFAEMACQPRQQLIGASFRDLIQGEERQALDAMFGSTEFKQARGQYLLAGRGGATLRVHVSLRRDEFDGTGRITAVVTDVSQCKQPGLLQQSEERFRTLIENSTDAIALLDPHGTILYESPAGSRILGYSNAELIGQQALLPVHPHDLPNVQAMLERLVARPGTVATSEFRFLHKDGSWLWLEAVGTNALSTPGIDALVVNFRDVTDRKLVEEKLRASETRFRSLIENSSGQTVILTADGILMYESPNAAPVLGYPDGVLLGREMWELVHPDDLPQLKIDFELLRDNPDMHPRKQFRLRRSDGTWRWVEGVGSNLLGEPSVHGIVLNFHDVTDRRMAGERLIQSERDLAEAQKLARMGNWRLDAATGSLRWSDELQVIFGIPEGAHVDSYEDFVRCIHPDDISRVKETSTNALATGEPLSLEYRIVTSTGDVRTISDNGYPVLDAQGNVTGLFGTAQDITERKRADKALRESEAMLRGFMEQSQDAILITDEQGVVVEWSRAAVLLTGYSREETVGKYVWDVQARSAPEVIRTPALRENIKSILEPILTRGASLFTNHLIEAELERPDGARLIAQTLAFPIPTEKGYRLATILRDVTEIKQTEDALRASEEMYRLVAESFDSSIATIDREGVVRYANSATARMMDLAPEDVMGKNLADLFPPRLAQDQIENVRKVISSQVGIVRDASSMVKGVLRWYRMSIQPIRGASGEMEQALINAVDITELKQAEAGTQAAKARMDAALASMTDAVFVSDAESRFVEFNEAFATFHRFKSKEECPRTVAEYQKLLERYLTDGQLLPLDMWAVPRALRGDTVTNEESFLRRTDTGEEWFGSYSFAPIRGEKGEITGAVVVARDITQQKWLQERLARNERLLRLFAEHAPAGIAMFDRDMRYIAASRRYIQDYRLPEQDLAGRSHYDVFPEIPERWKEIHRRCLAGAIEKCDADPFPRADGTLDWVRWEIHPWYESTDKIGGILLFSEVITERKRAEQAMRDSEVRYRALYEDSPVSLWEEDFSEVKLLLDALRLDGVTDYRDYFAAHPEFVRQCHEVVRITDVNQASLTLFGAHEKSELLGTLSRFLDDDLILQFEDELVNIAAGQKQFDWEGNNRTLDGRRLDIALKWSAMPGYEDSLSKVLVFKEDITERKQAELALRESEVRYRALYEDSPVSLWEEDFAQVKALLDALRQSGVTDYRAYFAAHPEFVRECHAAVRVTDVNRATLKLFGASEKEQLLGGLGRFLDEDIQQQFEDELVNIAEGKTQFDWDGSNRTPDGRRLDVALKWSAMPGHKDSLSKVLVYIDDVTERKQVEQRLKTELARFQRFVDSNIVGINISRADGSLILANDYYLKLLGVQRKDFDEGRVDWRKFTPPEWLPADEESIREGRERGIAEPYEKEYVRADGSRVQVLIADALLPGPDEQFAAFVLDISERKQAEEQLRYQATLLANIHDAMIGTDADFRITSWNQAADDMFGWKAEEVLGKDIRQVMPYADGPHGVRPADGGRDQFRGEYTLACKDGTPISVETSYMTMRDLTGRITARIGVSRDVTERKRAQERERLQVQRLLALREMDAAIASSFDQQFTLSLLLTHVSASLGVDAADVLLVNPYMGTLNLAASRGFHEPPGRVELSLGSNHSGEAARERRIVAEPDLLRPDPPFARQEWIAREGFRSYHGVPLIAKGEVKGVLEIFHRSFMSPDAEWLDFLKALADQVAIAIDNAQLFEGLQRSNFELGIAYDSTIEGWSRALDLRDKETEGHTRRVTEMAVVLARRFGLKDDELLHVRRGALLHDIGKLGVPDAILLKPGPLSEEEWAIMRKHPAFAYELLSPIRYLKSAAIDIPYCHHEKWDGSGYPRGLRGEQIPLSARIFSVVDVWDALTSDRPYRTAWSKEKALEHIGSQAGAQFDPAVVEAFLSLNRQ